MTHKEMFEVPARRTTTEYGTITVEAYSMDEATETAREVIGAGMVASFDVEELVEEQYDLIADEEAGEDAALQREDRLARAELASFALSHPELVKPTDTR